MVHGTAMDFWLNVLINLILISAICGGNCIRQILVSIRFNIYQVDFLLAVGKFCHASYLL